MKLNVMNMAGKKVGTVELNDELFNIEYNEALIHQIVVAQLANKRQGTKSTLTRAEVRGGGIKPYRQKGTGRARQGSIRSPQFVKGGVVFAPKPRDFSKRTNKFARRLALLSALSEKIRTNEVTVIDNIELKDAKTKEVVAVLKALGLDKTTLIVTADKDELVLRAAGNLEKVEVTTADLINVYVINEQNGNISDSWLNVADVINQVKGFKNVQVPRLNDIVSLGGFATTLKNLLNTMIEFFFERIEKTPEWNQTILVAVFYSLRGLLVARKH